MEKLQTAAITLDQFQPRDWFRKFLSYMDTELALILGT
jgi:hypothetical protein